MSRFDSPFNNVRIASPCNADWEQMSGNDRTRFCGQCSLNVYNLSSMTRAEAEQLIGRTEGRLCVRYFCRADGSIITQNCPIGLRAVRRKMSYVARAVGSAVLSFMAGLGIYEVKSSISSWANSSHGSLGTLATPGKIGVNQDLNRPVALAEFEIKQPQETVDRFEIMGVMLSPPSLVAPFPRDE